MAGRLMFHKILINPTNLVRPLLQKQQKKHFLNQRRNSSSDDFRIWPLNKMFNDCPHNLFCIEKIKKYFEVVPIIALVVFDIVGQTILITHNCLTRDDVRWFNKSPMHSEIIQMDPDKKPRFRKVWRVNEKVSQPDGPIEAYKDSDYIEKNKTFVSSPFNEKLFENDNKEPEPEPEPEPIIDPKTGKPVIDPKTGKPAVKAEPPPSPDAKDKKPVKKEPPPSPDAKDKKPVKTEPDAKDKKPVKTEPGKQPVKTEPDAKDKKPVKTEPDAKDKKPVKTEPGKQPVKTEPDSKPPQAVSLETKRPKGLITGTRRERMMKPKEVSASGSSVTEDKSTTKEKAAKKAKN